MIATPYLLSGFPKKDRQVEHSLDVLHSIMSAITAPQPINNKTVIGFIRTEPIELAEE